MSPGVGAPSAPGGRVPRASRWGERRGGLWFLPELHQQ